MKFAIIFLALLGLFGCEKRPIAKPPLLKTGSLVCRYNEDLVAAMIFIQANTHAGKQREAADELKEEGTCRVIHRAISVELLEKSKDGFSVKVKIANKSDEFYNWPNVIHSPTINFVDKLPP